MDPVTDNAGRTSSSAHPRSGRLSLAAAALALGMGVIVPQACTKRLPHGGEDPIYPLRGLHAAVPCEGCHGEGTPQALSTVCMDCHEEDRKDPQHHPGENCSPCHTEYGWDVGVTLTSETGGPPPTTGDSGTPPEEMDHSVPPTQLCWNCHEEDRKDYPATTHYSDPEVAKRWDCGTCHGFTTWDTELYNHPVRSPHGTYTNGTANPDTAWLVACATCHTAAPDYTTYICGDCHVALEPTFFPHFTATEPGAAADASCIQSGCHPTGD